MKLSTQQQIFSQDVAKLILYANSLGVNLTFGEVYRTNDQQELYYYGKTLHPDDRNLTVINDKKRTRTMNSNHLRRLAVDFNFFIDGGLTYKHPLIDKMGTYWENLSVHNKWGGHFKNFYDSPHFERNV